MRSRQRVRWAQLRVTVISAVALIIFAVLLYLLTGGMLFKEQTVLYLYIPDASGLTAGASPVTVSGINIGKVSTVVLSGSTDPKRVVRVTLTVPHEALAMIP